MNSTEDLFAQLAALETEGVRAFRRAQTSELAESARIEFLGAKNGRLNVAKEALKTLPVELKREYGRQFNLVKSALESAWAEARDGLAAPKVEAETDAIDVTRPGSSVSVGRKHPLTQTTEELVGIFGKLGFSVARGPEIEDVWHNFDALNIPPSHPARDPSDNFFTGGNTLLRSQTSTVQIRVMEKQAPPIRVIAIGKVYRPDETDETHSPMFHQIEGLAVDRNLTMADLKSTLRLFARSFLGDDVKIRFRPSFFPFTEPSVEVDMVWHGGRNWVEMGGAGMVDPDVFRAVGYDPDQVSGFAFGLGVERLCMRRFGIRDIRQFTQNDLRFLNQF